MRQEITAFHSKVAFIFPAEYLYMEKRCPSPLNVTDGCLTTGVLAEFRLKRNANIFYRLQDYETWAFYFYFLLEILGCKDKNLIHPEVRTVSNLLCNLEFRWHFAAHSTWASLASSEKGAAPTHWGGFNLSSWCRVWYVWEQRPVLVVTLIISISLPNPMKQALMHLWGFFSQKYNL